MSWADFGYKYRKALTIDHNQITGNLDNFPVLVSVTDADLKSTTNGGFVDSISGYDIIFYDSDDETKLDYELEAYVKTSGLFIAWVRVPSLLSTDDHIIYMYFGNISITTDGSSENTWDDTFEAVYHLDDIAGNVSVNSVGNYKSGTLYGGVLISKPGKIGSGCSFDGNADYASCQRWNSIDCTLEAWANFDTLTAVDIVSLNYDSEQIYYYPAIYGNGAESTLSLVSIGNSYQGGYTINTGTWYYAAVTYKNLDGTATGYINGQSVVMSGTNIPDKTGKIFNPFGYGNTNCIDGNIDEVRFSNVVRDSAWIKASYSSQNTPSNFITFGSKESSPPSGYCEGWISNCNLYYSGNKYPGYFLNVPIIRWDEGNWDLTIEMFLPSNTRETLFKNLVPGAYRELYNILGVPRYIDTTYNSGNTLILEPIYRCGLSGLRQKRTIVVKNISDTFINNKTLNVKIEGYILDS